MLLGIINSCAFGSVSPFTPQVENTFSIPAARQAIASNSPSTKTMGFSFGKSPGIGKGLIPFVFTLLLLPPK